MIDRNILLVADRVYARDEDFDLASDSLEQISDAYYTDLMRGLGSISPQVTHCQSPAELIDIIDEHRNDLVFTVYGGHSSRNRMALVPAICEAYQVDFVGADAYNRIVCQDKEISRELASKAGLRVARGIVIGNTQHISNLRQLSLPIILKPLVEGSSIGISQQNVCQAYSKAEELCSKLLEDFSQPVLAEEFVEGREIVVCCIGRGDSIKLCEAVEVYAPSDESFFLDRPYSADIKHHGSISIAHRIVTDEFSNDEMKRIKRLFLSFGKMDFMRIDGRLTEDGFVFIEFTPDAYIGAHSSFADIYRGRGRSYENLLQDIIETALDDSQTQSPTRR